MFVSTEDSETFLVWGGGSHSSHLLFATLYFMDFYFIIVVDVASIDILTIWSVIVSNYDIC